MTTKILIIASLLGVSFLLFVFRYIRKNMFAPSYSILWILVSVFLISIPLFESVYRWVANDLIGITDARHIIYIFLIGFLLIFNLYLTSRITQLTNQVRRLISSSAILDKAIRDIRGKEL